MPPTSGTRYQKILRTHYTSLQWKSAHVLSPELPDPEDYGWKWDNQHQMYDAIMAIVPPTPESIIEMTVCGHGDIILNHGVGARLVATTIDVNG